MKLHAVGSALRGACTAMFGLLAVLTGGGTQAAGLGLGSPAPDFALQGSDGKPHRLADYRGTMVVLAWFPKAFTGG